MISAEQRVRLAPGSTPDHVADRVAVPGGRGDASLPQGRLLQLEASKGLITALFTDPKRRNDKGLLEWTAWMKKYHPERALDDQANSYAYNVAILMTHVLKQCGNDLSRENIMRQAASIKVNTSATDFAPIEQEQLARFDGEKWAEFGEIFDAFRK